MMDKETIRIGGKKKTLSLGPTPRSWHVRRQFETVEEYKARLRQGKPVKTLVLREIDQHKWVF